MTLLSCLLGFFEWFLIYIGFSDATQASDVVQSDIVSFHINE